MRVELVCWSYIPLFLLASSALADEQYDGSIFGTTYHITVRDLETPREELVHKIQNRLQKIDSSMSNWKDDSEVSRFNQASANEWFPVSEETAAVVQRAQEISAKSEGMFDVTVSPLIRLWNFGAGAQADFTPPTQEQIKATLSKVGFDKLEVRLDPPALRKQVAGLELDLSAIAKGYAVDAVAALLREHDAQHFMVEIGGEVRTQGKNAEGSLWRIAIESPTPNRRAIDSVVPLDNQALATSGDYRNFHEVDGVTYSHTVNPKTGETAYSDLASVTVIADTCAEADALATTIKAMGFEEGLTWSEQHNIKAMLLRRTTAGIERAKTIGFPQPKLLKSDEGKTTMSQFFQLFIAAAVVFGIAILAMSIGTIVANRRLQGSCGGIAGLEDEHGKTVCDLCTRPSAECSGSPEADMAAAESQS